MLVTAFVSISSAATDDEILIFTKGVIASDSTTEGTIITIKDNNLLATYVFKEYDSKDWDMIATRTGWIMDAMIKVIQEYPDRFSAICVGMFEGEKLLALEALHLNATQEMS